MAAEIKADIQDKANWGTLGMLKLESALESQMSLWTAIIQTCVLSSGDTKKDELAGAALTHIQAFWLASNGVIERQLGRPISLDRNFEALCQDFDVQIKARMDTFGKTTDATRALLEYIEGTGGIKYPLGAPRRAS